MRYQISFTQDWVDVCLHGAMDWCRKHCKKSEYKITNREIGGSYYHLVRFHFVKKNNYKKFKRMWKDPMDMFVHRVVHRVIHPYTDTTDYYNKTIWLHLNVGEIGPKWRAAVTAKRIEFYFKKQEDCTFFVLTHTN